MKAFSTQYALTAGIEEIDGDVLKTNPSTFCSKSKYPIYFYGEGKNWHRTRAEAVKRADEMREKRIASLKKQIGKLERLRFE